MNRRRLFLILASVQRLLGHCWGAARALVVQRDLPEADLIVVLAGSSTYKERVRQAAQLVKEGALPELS